MNITDGNFVGLGSAAIHYVKGDTRGLQWGPWNQTLGSVSGVQLGFANISDDFEGGQLGFVNISNKSAGLQIGAVNIASISTGWQIGFVNINRANNAKFPVMVIVNGAF